jgi:hypothetical protein
VLVTGVTLILGVVADPGFHEYDGEVALVVAVSVAEEPRQIVGLFTVTAGKGLTVTVEVAELLHPFTSVPVTVYVVVVVGSAITELPVVEERSVLGDQVYVVAPVAVIVVLNPEHIETEGLTVTTGSGFTTTSTLVLGPSQLLLLTWLTQ